MLRIRDMIGYGGPGLTFGKRGVLMEKKLQQFQERRNLALSGGGAEKIKQQHEEGKATARERIEKLLDEGSFTEIGLFAGSDPGGEMENPAEGVVTGCGTIGGRRVYLFAQDYTVAGGAVGEIHAAKICRILDLAGENGAPVIGLYDSAGMRIDEGLGALEGYGSILSRQALYSGVIPQIAVVMGPCAGGAAFSPALADIVVMVEGNGAIFVAGPQVIAAVTGENVTVEEIGDARVHGSMSGVAHLLAGDDTAALKSVRTLLGYLPPNNLEDPPAAEPEEPEGDGEELLQIVSGEGKPYDVREIIGRIVDGGSFLEMHKDYAKNAVIGFARLGGRAVGVAANQPLVKNGSLDIDAADKIARFVRFCDSFNLPLFTFVDLPGYLPGVAQEQGGIVRHGAKIFYAYVEATVPKISLVLGRAYGSAAVAMSSRSLGADLCLAWPSAEIAALGPEGAAKTGDGTAGPYAAATRGWVDEVIDPRESRDYLRRALLVAGNKRGMRSPRKHGNIPL